MHFGVGEHTPIKLQSHDEMEKGMLFSFLPLKKRLHKFSVISVILSLAQARHLLCDADIVSKDKTENCVTILVSSAILLYWFAHVHRHNFRLKTV